MRCKSISCSAFIKQATGAIKYWYWPKWLKMVSSNFGLKLWLVVSNRCLAVCLFSEYKKIKVKTRSFKNISNPILSSVSAYDLKNAAYFWRIWKAFQNTEEWYFPFLNIFFRFREILYYSNLGRRWCCQFCNWNGKIFNNKYLWKYWRSVLQSSHQTTKESKWHLKCCCHGNYLNFSSFSSKTEYPPFATLQK